MTKNAADAVTLTAAERMQTVETAVLAAVARGEVDLNAIAIAELAARGLDRNGTWVGFKKADKPQRQTLRTDADLYNHGDRDGK